MRWCNLKADVLLTVERTRKQRASDTLLSEMNIRPELCMRSFIPLFTTGLWLLPIPHSVLSPSDNAAFLTRRLKAFKRFNTGVSKD